MAKMSLRAKYSHKWLLPLKVGIILGVIIGCWIGYSVISKQDYLGYHLYSTSVRILASNIDRIAVQFSAVAYLFWLMFACGMLFKGAARRTFRIIGYIVASMVTLRAVDFVYFTSESSLSAAHNAWQWLRVPYCLLLVFREFLNMDTARTFIYDCGWSSLLAVIVACVGFILLRRLRVQSLNHPTTEDASRVGRLRYGRFSAVFFSVFLAFFLCINLALGIFHVKGVIGLNHKPNIIFIAVDTLRADHLGCYGYSRDTTPNIDRFAGSSIRFDQAYSQAPWTTASFGSIITCRYPQSYHTGPVNNAYPLSDNMLTIAEALKDQGYGTGAVISNPYFGHSFNTQQGFDLYDDPQCKLGSSSQVVESQARKTINALKNGKFFLFLLFIDSHAPYTRHGEYTFMPGLPSVFSVSANDGKIHTPTEPYIQQAKAVYDSSVAFTDHYVGLVIDELKKQKLYDDSVVVVFADHGEEFGDHGGVYHGGTLYKELLHVPLIVKLPRSNHGTVVHGTFPMINLFPSLMKLIGCSNPAYKVHGTGVDLRSATSLPDEDLLAATNLDDPAAPKVNLYSIQSHGYKYIFDINTHKGKLFDVRKDAAEQHDIARENHSVESLLRNKLDKRNAAMGLNEANLGITQTVPNLSIEEKEKLHSLGYAVR